jgi:PAS domain S-box-containing protein
VLVLDAQRTIQRINQQAASWCGVAPDTLLGQPLAEAPLPLALGATIRQLLDAADAAIPREVWLAYSQRWLSLRLGPAPAGQHWLFWEDVTDRHQAEADRQRNSQLLLDMEAVAHTGSYEVDLTNGSFYFSDGMYRLFGEEPQAFVPTLDFIEARSHPDDAALVRQVLDEAVRTQQPYTYRRRIRRTDGQWRTLEAHGEVRTDAAGNARQLRGLVQDITERVQAEQALHESRALLRATIDSSLDMVQVFEAVRDEQGAVVDFAWVLNNAAAEQHYGDVIGQRLRQLNPGVVEEGIFDAFRQVLETGVPDQREHHYVHEQFDGWFYQSTVKLGDGVTTTTHNISQRKQAEQELLETKELLQATLDSSHYVVQAFEAVRDASGKIVDFTWILTNRVWLERYGGPMAGKSLL